MKVLKFILNIIWTLSLKNICKWIILTWHWLWSKTSFDEKAIAVVKETARRSKNAAKEMGDVKDALKGKKYKKK